ncbi:hypothetical protein ACFQ3Z_35495 [Streptomyces nogalater]
MCDGPAGRGGTAGGADRAAGRARTAARRGRFGDPDGRLPGPCPASVHRLRARPRPAPGRLTLAAGADSRGQLLYRTAEALAGRLASAFAEFPGGHLGTLDHPVEFADRLAETLGSKARTSA